MYGKEASPAKSRAKVTVPELRARKATGQKIAMVTAYDFTMARLVDEAGVDMVLVGDSLGQVIYGLPHTVAVTMEMMAAHGAAVVRGSYQDRTSVE
jgi:3-methyl-2-oxobutanoate hydroxymethyltransferase